MPTRARIDHLRARARRLIRRRRRPLAAAAAALAVVLGLASLRSPAPASLTTESGSATRLRSGEVAVPVALSTGALARSLTVGGVIDLVAVADTAPRRAHVVARQARVLTLPDSGSAFSPTTAAVITVAVPESSALDLIAANADGALSVLMRTSSSADGASSR